MQKAERELIELKFKGVYEHQEAGFEVISTKLEEIYKQTLLTNGRVNKIEDETTFFRWIEKHPKTSLTLSILIFAGSIAIGNIIGWDKILTKFI